MAGMLRAEALVVDVSDSLLRCRIGSKLDDDPPRHSAGETSVSDSLVVGADAEHHDVLML